MMTNSWVCYIVLCSDGSLYTGVTNDLEARVKAHNEGRGAKYTKGRTPVELMASSCGLTRSQAHRFETLVKSTRSSKKIATLLQVSASISGRKKLKRGWRRYG